MPEQGEQPIPQTELSKKGGRKEPVQLVLDPEDHDKNVVKPLLAKRPTPKREKALKKEIDAVVQSRFAKPNPLERRGR